MIDITDKTIENIKIDLVENIGLVKKYKAALAGLPEGGLQCRTIRDQKCYYYYPAKTPDSPRHRAKYIPAKNLPFAMDIAKKKLLEQMIYNLESNISAAEIFLEKYKYYDDKNLIEKLPKQYWDLAHIVLSEYNILQKTQGWSKDPHKNNSYHPEGLIVRAQNGTMVRSKSEAMILGQLETYGISYRYETRLEIADTIFYPDFTIMNPKGSEVIYWEHFGMVDNAEYASSMEKKLKAYREYGIIPWINLITTFETKNKPLDPLAVNRIVKAFLLPE